MTVSTRSSPARSSHAWRTRLESRWTERLIRVITLSLAYHDAADRGGGASRPEQARQARKLMRETVAARRALSDTEEALGRLSDGRFGTCEQCGNAIPAGQLAQTPEVRYCRRCTRSGESAAGPGRPTRFTGLMHPPPGPGRRSDE
jgi:RNA polymerase-binding transcription factor DksA